MDQSILPDFFNLTSTGTNLSRVLLLLLLLVVVPICIGLLFLQFYLSRRKSRWPGLLLPVLSGGIAVLLGIDFLSSWIQYRSIATAFNGQNNYLAFFPVVNFLYAIPILLLFVYCFVLTLIYIIGRRKPRREEPPYVGTVGKVELEKMNIQDL